MTSHEPAEPSSREPAERSSREPAERSSREPAERSGREPVERSIGTPAERPPGAAHELVEAFRELWLPLLVGGLLVVVTFVLWRHARDAQDAIAGAVTESEAGRVREELTRALDARAAALDGATHAVIEQGEAQWPRVASRLLDRDLGFRAIATLDTAMALGDVTPQTAVLGPWLAPPDSVARLVALRAALQSAGSGAAVAATVPLANGEPELVVGAIVPHAGAAPAYLMGVLRARDLLDAVLQRAIRHGFQVAVFDGASRIFGADEAGAGMEVARDTAVHRDAILWRLVVWPADEQMKRYDSWAAQAVLGLGMLLALAASLAVFLWQRVAELERGDAADA